MRFRLLVIGVSLQVAMLVSVSVSAEELAGEEALKAEAVSIVKQFGGALKPKLKQAVQSGGFGHAINICSNEAPKIAEQLSAETGWVVKRVSLKPRNNKSATADPFEKKILEKFDRLQLEGLPVDTMVHSEVIDNQYRFIKAQPVEGLCLGCHGDSLSVEVREALHLQYPDDMATGYSLGQIRGAFSLTKPL